MGPEERRALAALGRWRLVSYALACGVPGATHADARRLEEEFKEAAAAALACGLTIGRPCPTISGSDADTRRETGDTPC